MRTGPVLRAVAALLIVLAARISPAQIASPWRVWTKEDGLSESFAVSLGLDTRGRLLVRHGSIGRFSTLDGYGATSDSDANAYGSLHSDREGWLWAFDAEGILIRDASGWHKYPDADIAAWARKNHLLLTPPYMYDQMWGPQPPTRAQIVPLGKGSAIIMLPDRLFAWSRPIGQKEAGRKQLIRTANQTALETFRDLATARDGGVWITGERGLAHLSESKGSYRWSEMKAPAGLRNFMFPMEGRNLLPMGSEVFLSALNPQGNWQLMRYAVGNWQEIFRGGKSFIRGWRGPAGELWIQNGDHLLIQKDQGFSEVTIPALAGLLSNVIQQPNGDFWVGSREGFAHYSPALWRTPPEVASIGSAVRSMVEDPRGRIWYGSDRKLILNDHGTWRHFSPPDGLSLDTGHDCVYLLKNGDLVLRLASPDEVLVFHPANAAFSIVPAPRGTRIGAILSRPAGDAWIELFEGEDLHGRLEIFDGSTWRRDPAVPPLNMSDLRIVRMRPNGDIWVGGGGGFTVIHNGQAKQATAKDGLEDSAIFAAVDRPNGNVILGGVIGITEFDGHSFRLLQRADIARGLALAADGWLWAASNTGIYRVRPRQSLINTADDGLPSSASLSVFADSQGRIWAGTSRGLGLFYPSADIDAPLVTIPEEENLRKTPPGGEVHITYSGKDRWKYTPSSSLTFSVRLDGAAWSPFTPAKMASFRGLPAGAHLFEVRAMDSNANVSVLPAAYFFTVLLPWYRESAFIVFAGLALLIIALLLRVAWRHHRRIAYQSSHDPLTGVVNRAVFEPQLLRAITEARDRQKLVAVMLLDLDRFKLINDTVGHGIGDRFLQIVSRRIEHCIRKQDTLARMGGDEFAIIMGSISSQAEAVAVADRIVKELRKPYQIDSYELVSSASVGISFFPDHGEDGPTLQRLADMAMYQSKAKNKDQYIVFDPEVNRIDFRGARMAGLIREALENDYFRLHYQPYQTIEGELVGLEALIRLEHPRLGQIPPDDFISVAEDTGLIVRVGEWVLRESCRQMAQWHKAGFDHLRISVNVSAAQLSRQDFVVMVEAILRETQLPPRALTLEVTETVMMRNHHEAALQIIRLRQLGVTVALDDFGVGYSSLSSLHLLPVDYIKIDRSFIQRLGAQEGGPCVVEAMIGLAHQCGFEVVAEGVESDKQLDSLKAAGADFIQGFLLGRPLAAEPARELLNSRELIPQKQ